ARKTKNKERERHYRQMSAGGAEVEMMKARKDDEFLRSAFEEKLGQPIKEMNDQKLEQLLESTDLHLFGLTRKQIEKKGAGGSAGCSKFGKLTDAKKRRALEQDIEDTFNPTEKQDARVALNRFDKLQRKARRDFMIRSLKSNVFLARTEGDLKMRQSKKASTMQHLTEMEKLRRSALPTSRGISNPSAADKLAEDFFIQRLGWNSPKDEQLEHQIKTVRHQQNAEGEEMAGKLMAEKTANLELRLNSLVDLALDERGILDGTLTRRQHTGQELGQMAQSYGVPRFVPSVHKEHFRELSDLGADPPLLPQRNSPPGPLPSTS
ncbi:hypothetical protein CYMTET_28020, partial [Cymbomonas tetramitiformis]